MKFRKKRSFSKKPSKRVLSAKKFKASPISKPTRHRGGNHW